MTEYRQVPVERLRELAEEIAAEGHAGWPNELNDIADAIAAAPKPDDEATHLPKLTPLLIHQWRDAVQMVEPDLATDQEWKWSVWAVKFAALLQPDDY